MSGRKRKSVYENKLLVSILLLIFVEPLYFEQVKILSSLHTIASFIATIFLVMLFVIDWEIKFSKIWIMAFWGCMFFSTCMRNGDIYTYIRNNYALIGACLLFELWSSKKADVLLDASVVLSIYVYINFITVLLFPEGMYNNGMYSENWFLGYKNPQIRTILPVVALNIMREYWKYGKMEIHSYLLMLCAVLTFARIDSATSIVGIAIFLLMISLFHGKRKKLPRILNLFSVYIISAAVFLGIVLSQIQSKFSWLIENVLQRNLTFTTRTYIWNRAISLFVNNKIWGMGYISSLGYSQIMGSKYATHPHNYFLYILLCGGVVLLMVLTIGIIFADKMIQKYSGNIYSKIILFTLISFFVMGIVEALVSTVLMYPILIMAMNLDHISELSYKRMPHKIFGRSYSIVFHRKVKRSCEL